MKLLSVAEGSAPLPFELWDSGKGGGAEAKRNKGDELSNVHSHNKSVRV